MAHMGARRSACKVLMGKR